MNPPQLNRMPWNQFYLSPKVERTLITPNLKATRYGTREGLSWYLVRIGDSAKYRPSLVQSLGREEVRKLL